MSGTHKAKGSKKNRKWGRNKIFCDTYKRTNQEEKNKVVRLNRHLRSHPDDLVASNAKDAARRTISGK